MPKKSPSVSEIEGIDKTLAKALKKVGLSTAAKLAVAEVANLTKLVGITEATAKVLVNRAQRLVPKHESPVPKASPEGLLGKIRKKFSKKSKLGKKLSEMEQLTDKELARKDLQERLFTDRGGVRKKKKVARVRLGLQQLLIKAGVDMEAEIARRILFRSSVILSLMFTLALLVVASIKGSNIWDIAIFMLAFWTVGFALVLALLTTAGATFLDIQIVRRRNELEEVLPDYLQLVAANIGAGMTVDRALWYAVRPRFGVLAKEIETVAKRVFTGEELSDALRDFTKRYDSPVLQRSINLLLEGIAAGGKVADLLHKISNDISEQRILRQEMAANVMTYVIFISFAAVLAAPILFGLSTQLLVVIQGIAGNIGGSGGSSTGLSVSADVINLSDFRIFSVSVLAGTAMMSALIISVIRKGSAFDGLRYIPIFVFISILLYFLAISFFGGLFGGIV